MTIKELKNHLDSNQIFPVYLLTGGEIFLQKEALRLIKQKIVTSKDSEDFNYNVFYAGEHTSLNVLESLEMLPVLAESRLVVCRDIHLFKAKDWSLLIPALQKPFSSVVFVLVAPELDKRKKISKTLLDLTHVVHCRSPKQGEIVHWVKWLASSHQMNLSAKALDLLIRLSGPSLMNIDNELRKLKSSYSSSEVTEEDIVKGVARVRPENVFAFTEAIGRQDLSQSFHFLVYLLEDQESEVGILSLVTRHMRILRQIKESVSEGLRPSEISARAGIPSFFLKDYMKQVQVWDERKLVKVTEILHATDRALKSSPLSSHIWLENFVLKACSL